MPTKIQHSDVEESTVDNKIVMTNTNTSHGWSFTWHITFAAFVYILITDFCLDNQLIVYLNNY